MKKLIKGLAVALAAIVLAVAAGCGTATTTSSNISPGIVTASLTNSAQELPGEGDLSNGYVKITDVTFFDTGQNFITLEWTNETSETSSFDDNFDVEIYQDGASLSRASNPSVATDNNGTQYNPSETTRKVQSGSSLTVYYPFDLLPNSVDGKQVKYANLEVDVYSKNDRSKKVVREYGRESENSSSSVSSTVSVPNSSSSESSTETEHSFKNGVLTASDAKIEIKKATVIKGSESDNFFSDEDAYFLVFEFRVTNLADYNQDAFGAWVQDIKLVQDNDPTVVNELDTYPVNPIKKYAETWNKPIKKGATLDSAIAYKLSDTKTPVVLTAYSNFFFEKLGTQTYDISKMIK